MTTETRPIHELADNVMSQQQAADERRAGRPEYDRVLAPEIAAARQRVADRKALAADGVTLKLLRAALPTFAPHEAFQRAAHAERLRRDTAAAIRNAIEALTDRLARDEQLIDAIEKPSLEELKTYVPSAFQRSQIDHLRGFVQGANGIRELLTDEIPRAEAELRRLLQRASEAHAGSTVLDDAASMSRRPSLGERIESGGDRAVRAAPEDEP